MAKNNVYNFIRIKGDEEEVKRMMAAVTVMTDEGIPCFDFNKVIPMPEELRVTHDGISAIRGHINNYLTMVNPCTPVYDSSFEKLSDKDFAELYKAIFKYYNQERTHLVNCYLPSPDAEEARIGEKLVALIVVVCKYVFAVPISVRSYIGQRKAAVGAFHQARKDIVELLLNLASLFPTGYQTLYKLPFFGVNNRFVHTLHNKCSSRLSWIFSSMSPPFSISSCKFSAVL